MAVLGAGISDGTMFPKEGTPWGTSFYGSGLTLWAATDNPTYFYDCHIEISNTEYNLSSSKHAFQSTLDQNFYESSPYSSSYPLTISKKLVPNSRVPINVKVFEGTTLVYTTTQTKTISPASTYINTVSVSPNSVTLQYPHQSSNAGEYTVIAQYSLDQGSTWIDYGSAINPKTQDATVIISGLSPETKYNIRGRLRESGTITSNTHYSSYYPTSVTTPKAQKLYGSVNDQSKEIKKLYGSVNGQSKEIKKLYASVNGVSKRIF